MITSLDSNGLRFDMFTGEERFIAPNAVLVSARTDAVLIDCGFVKSDVDKLLHLVKVSGKRLRAISSPTRTPITTAASTRLRRPSQMR